MENKVKGGSNAIIKTISGDEVQGKDGDYFRTNRNAYVVLPSFEANNVDGLSIFIDAKLNQRPIEQHSRLFTLGYFSNYTQQLSMSCGISEFGLVRNFTQINATNLIGDINSNYPISMKVGVMVGDGVKFGKAKNYLTSKDCDFKIVQTYNHTFNNNFLCAENPTTLSKADVSYGLVLIYNRALTEEEMQHNYEYSLLLKRG